MPPIYVPFVYFYALNPKIPSSEISNHLKKSLSEILSRFYPLAGRHVGNHYVDCNDGGAPFLEAEADCDLSQFILPQNPKILNSLLPYKMDELRDFCMAAQATYFRCGGLAVSILISHKIADALSLIFFVNAWSAVARNGGGGDEVVPPPKFDAAAYFPPLEDTSVLDPTAALTKEKITTKIFRFPAAAVSLLQQRYSGGGKRPSQMQALSAFIWTRFVSATRERSDPNKTGSIYVPINLRNRVDPPLSKYHFGNIIRIGTATPAARNGGVEVVQKIREAVKAVDTTPLNNPLILSFSSLCRSSLYEADFGWGKPVWVGLAQFPIKNVVFLFDTKCGGGIEA